MKHLGKLSFGLLAMLMTACSSDEPITPGGDPTLSGESDVCATLTLKLPSSDGTRANNGEEFGKDFENNVGKILVVLATKDETTGTYKYLTRAVSDSKSLGQDGNTVSYVLNFSSEQLTPDPLDKDGEGNPTSTIPGTKNVYVFTFCNPSQALLTSDIWSDDNPNFIALTGKVDDQDDAAMWTKNQFLMTNCGQEVVRENGKVDWLPSLPVNIPDREALVRDHNTPEKAFKLGTVKVKRAAARFDFMSTFNKDGEENTYDIKDIDATTVIGKVQLTDMAMFNIASEFYYIPRTNADWSWTGTTTVCGDLEGFVMSPYRTNRLTPSNSWMSSFYYYDLIPGDGKNVDMSRYNWVSIRDWNTTHGGEDDLDNDEGWTPGKDSDYRIWRYASENTIPGGSNGSTGTQVAGISTGVVFKGEFVPVDTKVWNGKAVYVFNNIVYGDYETLKKYCTDNPKTDVAIAFDACDALKNEPADPYKSLLAAVPQTAWNGFKAYEAEKQLDGSYKYIMYYFYYNRHESNGKPYEMGTNEFGVVRNNVYKLSVTTVRALGDPTTPPPTTKDEDEKAYFTVSCIVMPWTVRVNNIEF